jgi:hypothetical protein
MKSFARCLAAACLLMCAAFPAFAQSRNTGEIRGTVTDPSGAAVAGATVTVTNVDTGVTTVFTTNEAGLYDTVSTQTGNYNITITAPGFKKFVRGPFTLQIDPITEDGQLEVGAQTDTVTVEAQGVPLLETETGHLGTVFEAKTIGVLPQIGAGITGNDWANFNVLLPGATGAPSQPMSEGSGAYNAGDAVSINGNLPNYANYLLDGAVVQLPVSNNVDNLVFEAVQEVQITTSSFSAEYGIGGAVFNQISKSGSNGFHGSAYEFWQNDILNASPYFQPNNGAAFLRYDEWGGSIGGPIIKNRLFFYFVRDKIYNNGATSPQISTVPTLAERGQGTAFPGDYDFSGTPTIYQPSTRGSVGGASIPFPNNVIPAGQADPVAVKLLSYYPAPNRAGDFDPAFPGAITNNYTFTPSAPNPNLRYFGRIDFTLNEKNHMSFSIAQKNNNGQNHNATECPLNCFSGDIDGYNVQYSDTWTLSPNLVNEFRMGYTKQGNWFVPQTIGFDNAGTLGLQYAKADVFPNINITDNGVCCSQLLQPGTNAIYIENLYDPSDTITLVKGRHVLHFGVEVLMGQGNTTPWGNVTAGNFKFTGQYTALNVAGGGQTGGSALADFILGDVQNWQAVNQTTSYARLKSPQLFVQDDIKVKPNLTINLGLRYTATTGFSENNNALGGFDPNLVNPYDGTLGSMWFAGQDNRNTLQKPVYDIFLPRVGFAWSWRPDTVIRGGFGMYSYNFSQDTYGQGIGAGALTTSTGNTTDPNNGAGPNPLINLDSSAAVANTNLTYVVGSPAAREPLSYCCTPGLFSSQQYVPYHVHPAQINQWQLSVEHQLGHEYMVSAAYVGSHGYNLQYETDLNQITDPTLLQENVAAGKVIQANRQFPDWGNLQGNTYNAKSNYNALQLEINKHYSNGLMFSFNYVWSHFLDDLDSSGWGSRGGTQTYQIGNDPKSNYANSNFDIPQAFKGYVAYELPFGTGKRFANSVSKPVDAAIGGWRVSGTMVTQSGNPFTITESSNGNLLSGCGNCTWYPDRAGNPRSGASAFSAPDGTIGYLNRTGIVDPASGTFGNNGRNSVFGPRLTVFNFSVAKQFSFTERIKLELRSDWVNIFNHPSFGPPSSSFPTGVNDPTSQNFNNWGNYGLINSSAPNGGITVAPRSGQLSAKVTF